jgi:hypothetical protein
VNKTSSILATFAVVIFGQSLLVELQAATPDDPIAAEYEAIRSGKESLDQFRANIAKLSEGQKAPVASKERVSHTEAQTPAVPAKNEFSLKTLEDYISIRKSFLSADDEKEPANFSWTRSAGAPSFYSVDLAILLKGFSNDRQSTGFSFLGGRTNLGDYKVRWKIEPTFEAHISTEETNAQDSMSARLPITLSWYPHSLDTKIKEWFLTVSPVYEFDRLKNNETIGGDAFLTANIPSIGVGEFLWLTGRPTPHFKPNDGLVFHWRPFIGFEGGHVIKAEAGTVLSEENEYARFSAKVHGELAWVHKHTEKEQVSYQNKLVIAVDYYLRQDFTDSESTHNYVELSPTLYLDDSEHFSMGLTYKNGQTTPQFSNVDELTLWLGVKF